MRSWLLTISTVGLLLFPFAVGAADYGSSSPDTGTLPPVAQPLVREGDFAIRLAAQLDLGAPADEATAEDMLARAGVAPLNGWMSDYPVTPQIIGQLQESVSRAASEGKLPMTADEAVRGLFYLAAQYELPTPADPRSPAPEKSAQTAQPQQANPAVINNYYGNYGPPVVTYYAPPPDYLYLYAWVPYPYWWFGFWYPGFYISHSFTTVVVVRPGVTAVVTNRFIDRTTRRVVVVDPNGTRTVRHGGARPDSVLRTDRGDRYRSLTDMRSGVRIAGPPADVRTRVERDRTPGAQSPHSRSITGAGAGRPRSDNVARMPENRLLSPPGHEPGALSRQRIERSRDETVPSRTYNTDRPALRSGPNTERRSFEPARPSGGYERRSWQPVPGGQIRPFTGERGNGREEKGGRGSFPGGACRGVRC